MKMKTVALRHNCTTELIFYFLVPEDTDISVLKEVEYLVEQSMEEYGKKHNDDFIDFDYIAAVESACDLLKIDFKLLCESETLYV